MRDHKLREWLGMKEVDCVVFPDSGMSIYSVIQKTQERITALEETLLDTCTYCEKKVPKGQLWETGEMVTNSYYCNAYTSGKHEISNHKACEECLAKFQEKCKAAKIGYKNRRRDE